MYDEKELKWFDRMGVARPSHDAHGTPEEIRASLKQARCWGWHLKGNVLHAQTEFGPMAQTIPTNVICLGTDPSGLPIFKKIVL